ncbi:MAG: hypothetical protein E8D50_09655 [Nitrospira sp.]|nr:MAG: hypothetical protein E8D50_09655 [Nitrospira sp.]
MCNSRLPYLDHCVILTPPDHCCFDWKIGERETTVLSCAILPGLFAATLIAVSEVPVSPSTQWLDRVGAKIAVTTLNLSTTEIAGIWSDEGPTAGSYLYLFPDGIFVYTEAADIMPETIYDKGTWRVESNMLMLAPDTDVTWNPTTDRHFVMLRVQSGNPEPLLLGVDHRIHVFEHLVAAKPKSTPDYLVLSSLRKKSVWANGAVSREKARLGKNSKAWRPCWFTDAGCPHPGTVTGK